MVMARLAVDTASQTEIGVTVLPPIEFSTDWNYLIGLAGGLVAIGIAVMIIDIVSVGRINVASSLRTTGKSG